MTETKTYIVRDLSYGATKNYDLDFGSHESSQYNSGVTLTNWQYLDFQQWCKTRDLGYTICLVAHHDIVGVDFARNNRPDLLAEFEQRWVQGPYAVRDEQRWDYGSFQTKIGFLD